MLQPTKCKQYGDTQNSISLQKNVSERIGNNKNSQKIGSKKAQGSSNNATNLFRVSALEKLAEKNRTYDLHLYDKVKRKLRYVSIFTYVYNDNNQYGNDTTDSLIRMIVTTVRG